LNLKGQPAHVGKFCGSNEYTVTDEVVAFYSDALDDTHPLHARFAPPLLHHSECYKFVGDWYLANLFGNLHAQQDWEIFDAIPIGARLRSVSTIVDRYIKRGRDYVINETDLFDAQTHQLYVRGRTYQSFLPPKPKQEDEGFVVDASTARAKPKRPDFPTATGPDLTPVQTTIDERRCWMFSGPGKNYHTDREQAEKLGFPNIVVQGMMSTCFVSKVMQQSFGEGWLRGGKMSLKLTNVLWVDETVEIRGKIRDEVREGTRTRIHCDVWVDKTDGTRVALGSASAMRDEDDG
jgi:acyl dehydratase